MSFGFSVGDFVTCLILLKDVAQALNESTGSISDFKKLTQTLKSLENALITSELVYQQWEQSDSATACKEANKAVVNGIKFERQQCREILENFMKTLKPYTDAFDKGRSKALIRRVRMVMWAVRGDDVSKLNRDLEGHLRALQMYGEVLTRIQADENTKRAIVTRSAVNDVLSNAIEMRAEFTAISNYIRSGLFRMPISLGYPWERDATLKENVLLHDAIGRKILLPMVLMSKPSVLHDTLMLMYRGLPGRKRISRKEYTITDEDSDGTLIEETKWSKAIQQGMQISLHVNLPASPSLNVHRCPRCDEPCLGDALPDRRRRCQKCQLTFRIFDQERVIEEPECASSDDSNRDKNGETSGNTGQDDLKTSSLTKSTANKDSRWAFQNLKRIDEDDYHFQSVHYYRDVQVTQALPLRSNIAKEERILDIDDLPPLHLAAAKGQIADITSLLSNGADVNMELPLAGVMRIHAGNVWIFGCSPLHIACLFNKMRLVDVLLSHGANINAVDLDGASIVEYAIYGESHGRIVLPLLSRGANGNIRNHAGGYIPLHFASKHGISWLIHVLVESGSDPNDMSKDGWAPLHFAAIFGNNEVVQALLEEDADINIIENVYGWKPLHCAAHSGSQAMVEMLLRHGAAVNVLDADGDTPLHLACVNGNEGAVKALLAWGADISAHGNERGSTPLHEAAHSGKTGALQLLLDGGANIFAVDMSKESVIGHAVRGGNCEIVQLLLSHGADTTIVDDHMISPLMAAAHFGYDRILELLFENGAKVTDVNDDGWSPLIYASTKGHESSVRLLVRQGAEINHQDKKGATALHHACGRGHERVVKVLLSCRAEMLKDENGNKPLQWAAMAGEEHIAKLLLQHGEDPNAKSNDGMSTIVMAILGSSLAVTKVLIEGGADYRAVLYRNKTPLFWAVACANFEIVELLLKDEIAVDLCSKDGRLPWRFHCPELDGKCTQSFFNILLRHGWDKNEQGGEGFTVLHIAAAAGNEAITNLLISLGCDPFVQDDDGNLPIHNADDESIVKLLEEAMMKDERYDQFKRDEMCKESDSSIADE